MNPPSFFHLPLRFCDNFGLPLEHETFFVSLNNQQREFLLGKEGTVLPLYLDESDWTGSLILDHCEMVDLKTGYPAHKQIIPLASLKNKVPPLTIKVIPPPIVVHLGQRNLLTTSQLNYFKTHGKNALLFIHGYHIELGEYGCYPNSYIIEKKPVLIEPHLKTEPSYTKTRLRFQKSHYKRTICCNLSKKEELESLYPELGFCYSSYFAHHSPENNPEGFGEEHAFFNGTGARQWFVQMEYNLNQAAGFKKDYSTYTRILGVHWPGNVQSVRFKKAEAKATDSAQGLLELILQLHQHQIQINIIAHSLGARVVLQMMDHLSKQTNEPLIESVILWQAAVPNTLFNKGGAYESATNSTKKIIVLYSREDTILQTLYRASHLNHFSHYEALGYSGVKHQHFSPELYHSGKLIMVDQSNHLSGHSFMKIPTSKMMQEIYQEYIIGGTHGIKQFGHYELY